MKIGRERCEEIGDYVLNTGSTVRQAAEYFGISKSTVHKDLTYKLERINKSLYNKVKVIIDLNKAQRHIRGGEATRRKYLERRTSTSRD